MDVLADVMQTVRVRSHLYGRAEFTAPWGVSVPHEPGHAGFLVVSRGSCWLEVDGIDGPIPLAGGDFVFFPHGVSHRLRDAMHTPLISVDDIPSIDGPNGRVCSIGGGGMPTSVFWGCFQFEGGGRNPLIESLPPMIHLPAEAGPQAHWLQATLQLITAEISSGLPGSQIVANRLTDILFVHAIRAHISGCAVRGCRGNGWLRALADPKIGESLRLIHKSPEDPWTVESLARAVSMSRSAFAARFTTMVGESPLRYITSWRIRKATDMLVRGDPIGSIAQSVGYDTDAAFAKAFKKQLGMTPGEYRRLAREGALKDACTMSPPAEAEEVAQTGEAELVLSIDHPGSRNGRAAS